MSVLLRVIFALHLAMSVALAGSNTTGDLACYKPADDETSWGENVRDCFDAVDAQVTDVNKFVLKAQATFADADTTPSISGGGSFKTANTGATTITDFDDVEDNQIVVLIAGDGNTTIADGSGIELMSNQSETLTTNQIKIFYHDGTDFREFGGSVVSDAAVTAVNPLTPVASGGGWLGDGSDGTGPSTTANLDDGDNGKQYTSWAITAANTITLTDTDGVHIFRVQGTFSIGSGGELEGSGAGIPNTGANTAQTESSCAVCATGGGASVGTFSVPGDGGGTYTRSGGSEDVYSGNASAGSNAVNPPMVHTSLGMFGPSPAGGSSDTRAGGNGGPLIIIFCDTFDNQGTIDASGADGTGGYLASGGGAGGTIIVYTRNLTNTGTMTVSGGAGGVYGGSNGGAGGDGQSYVVVVGN